MKLFKNEVGRPSNETKRKRKIVVISFIAIMCVLITNISMKISSDLKLKEMRGLISFLNFSVNIKMNDGKVKKNTLLQKENIIYGPGTYTADLTIKNSSKKSVYGRLFNYDTGDITKTVTSKDTSCTEIGKTLDRKIEFKVNSNTGKMSKIYKIYYTKAGCESDTNGKLAGLKVYRKYTMTYNAQSSNDKMDVQVSKLAGKENKAGIIPVEAKTHEVKFDLTNSTNQTKYFRWALYGDIGRKTIAWNAGGCQAFDSNVSKTFNVTISNSVNGEIRVGALRLYDNKEQCEGDSGLKGKYVKEKTFTYAYNNNSTLLRVTKTGLIKETNETYNYDSNNTYSSKKTGKYEYHTTYTLNNLTGENYYYNWFTYSDTNYNSDKPLYGSVDKCTAYSKTIKVTGGLTVNTASRSGKLKVYKTLDDCKKDANSTSTQGVISTNPVTIKVNPSGITRTSSAVKAGNWSSYVSVLNTCLPSVAKASKKYSVSADLIMAVIFQERSTGNSSCIWVSGAQYCGLMAVNPSFAEGYSANDLTNYENGIMAGTKILKDKLNRWKNASDALCHYNVGDYAYNCYNYPSNILNTFRPEINRLYTFSSDLKFNN